MSLLSRMVRLLLPRIAHVFAILLCAISLILLLIAGAAHYVLASMASQYRPVIERELSRTLGRAVHIGNIHIDAFSNIVLTDSAIAHGNTFDTGVAMSIQQTTARVNLFTLLWNRGLDPVSAIEQLELRQPKLTAQRYADGRFDFADVLDRLRGAPSDTPFRAQLRVTDGAVTYRDEPTGITQQLAHVDASLRPRVDGGLRFSISGRDPQHRAERVRLAGAYRPAEGRARVRIRAEHVDVKLLSDLLPKKLPITFEDGTAALRLSALLTNLPTPEDARRSPQTTLSAEVDLRGVGLRLDELTTPVVATSGRLRLTHDPARYPQGSRLELINVNARARDVPLTVSGSISELDVLNLSRLNPLFDVRIQMATRDGRAIARLFPRDEWVHGIALNGPATLDARVTGQAADLHIAGTLASHRFSIRGVQAENVTASFKLTPSDTTTLSAGVTVQRLQTGNVTLDNIAITVSSATPWRQLESAPVLTGTVRAARARLPWFTLPDLSGDVAATTDGIAVTNLRTAIFSGATAASLRIPFLSRTTVARAEADFADMNLAQLSRALHLPSLAGHISGHLALRMLPGGGMTLNTRIHSSDAAYREYETSHLDADLRIDVGNDTLRVTIPRAFARTAYGEFTAADGRYQQGMEGVGLLTMALRGERIPLAMFGDDTEYGGYATLVGTLSGDPLVPMLTAAVTVNDGMLLGRAFTEGIGKMTYQAGGALRFRDVVLTRPGLRLEMAGGTDGFDPRDGMVGQEGMLHLQGAPLADVLNIVGLDFPWQVDGGMRGVVALHVGERGITARGTTFIPDTVVHIPHGDSVFPLDLRRIALDFDYADRTLQVRNLRLERRDTLVMATGTVQCPLGGELNADLTYQAADTELGDIPRELLGLPVRLSGAADIHGFLRGDLNGEGDMPLTVTATAKAPRFTAAGFPLGSGDIALTYTYRPQDRQVIFDHLTVENAAFTARASGRYLISRGEVGNVEISVDPLRLEKLPTALSEMSGLEVSLPGEVSGMGLLRLRASGPVMKPSLHAEVALRDGTFGSTLLPNLQATLTGAQLGSRYQLRLENALASDASGTMLARANGVIFGDGAPDLRFSARDITPKLLTTWIDSSLPIGGSVDVDGTLRGSWLSPVAEIEVAIDTPSFGDRVLHRASGHLRLTRTGISLADGEIWFHANGPPITTQGTLPLRWEAWVPAVPVDEPFALDLTFPRQALSPWLALLPGITDLRGSVEGSASIHGTLKQPILRNGHLTITGSADLPETTDGNPDRADDIEMRLSASGDRRGVSLDIEHLSMRLDRVGAKAFQPGWLSSEGTVHIPASVLRDPQRWQWDVYAKLMRVPLSTETFLVPQATGYLRLGSAADGLELTGILLIDNTKLKKPSLTANAMSAWGPFPLNPHLRVVVQVGDAVKLKSGIFSVPLRPTPLAQLPATTIIPGVQPSLAIDRDAPEYRTSAAMMNVGTANEMTGTWGVIIGTLNDPAIYARFEVEKSKVGFPLKLFSAVRNARGHITFSRAGGPRIVMGIPEFPIASTPTARAATP